MSEKKEGGCARRAGRRGIKKKKKRPGSSVLTTCAVNNRVRSRLQGAVMMKRGGSGFLHAQAKARSERASHARQASPLLSLIPVPCSQTHIQSLARSLPAHWLVSTERQRVKRSAHCELPSGGARRQLREVNTVVDQQRKGSCTALPCGMRRGKRDKRDFFILFLFHQLQRVFSIRRFIFAGFSSLLFCHNSLN